MAITGKPAEVPPTRIRIDGITFHNTAILIVMSESLKL
jgi:hypothetical protein